MPSDRKRKYSFEDIFTNENQIKILVVLASKRKTTKRSKAAKLKQAESFGYLKKRTRVTNATLKDYLHCLVTSGFVQELDDDGETVYRFAFESEKGKALKKLFQLLKVKDD